MTCFINFSFFTQILINRIKSGGVFPTFFVHLLEFVVKSIIFAANINHYRYEEQVYPFHFDVGNFLL